MCGISFLKSANSGLKFFVICQNGHDRPAMVKNITTPEGKK